MASKRKPLTKRDAPVHIEPEEVISPAPKGPWIKIERMAGQYYAQKWDINNDGELEMMEITAGDNFTGAMGRAIHWLQRGAQS